MDPCHLSCSGQSGAPSGDKHDPEDGLKVGYTCIFCKRMLLRYAEKIAEKQEADAIVMGDSLGQVASQTLHNINVINSAVKIPIIRPLIGYDKEDIVKIAKEIGTYDLSILPSDPCKEVPNKPATQAKLDKILDDAFNSGLLFLGMGLA